MARLCVNLRDTLAAALEALPEPFASWVTSGAWNRWEQAVLAWWRNLDDQDDRSSGQAADALFEVRRWCNARHLEMHDLAAPPTIRLWRVGDSVTFAWDTRGKRLDGVPCWVETQGQQSFSTAALDGEVAALRARLDLDMQLRLQEVAAPNRQDDRQRVSLQCQHEETLSQERHWEGAEWAKVQAAVSSLEGLPGIRLH